MANTYLQPAYHVLGLHLYQLIWRNVLSEPYSPLVHALKYSITSHGPQCGYNQCYLSSLWDQIDYSTTIIPLPSTKGCLGQIMENVLCSNTKKVVAHCESFTQIMLLKVKGSKKASYFCWTEISSQSGFVTFVDI